MKRIYLDWNATAPILQASKLAIIEALNHVHGNASSIHMDGQRARSVVERTRRKVAKVLGSPAQAVVFTGGATESNNQVLRHHMETTVNPVLACLSTEHPSVLEVVKEYKEKGSIVHIIPVNNKGKVDWANLVLDPHPTLLSCMFANNETGVIYDLRSARSKCDEWKSVLHVDATQGIGREDIDFEELGIDFLTSSFHKMGGPKGVGVIVIREGLKIDSILAGGHQERGRRPGTENVPAIAGVLSVLEKMEVSLKDWRSHTERLRARFLKNLDALDFQIRGQSQGGLRNTLNLSFGIDGEDVLLALDLEGVSASSGSACTAGSLEPSHVILAMGFDEKAAKESLRFSFGPSTQLEEIDHATKIIVKTVEKLKLIEAAGGYK